MSVALEYALPEVTALTPASQRRRTLYVVPDIGGNIDTNINTNMNADAAGVSVERATAAPAGVVVTLFAPRQRSTSKLTRRGVVVLTALVGALVATLVALAAPAWVSAADTPARATAGTAAGTSVGAPATQTVTVRSGDTLWSIATRVAPNRDPRAEVDHLRRLNGLSGDRGVQLLPGQVLRTR